ncbi:MAG: cytochrome c [Actinomycetota bacterium]|nr:cytochrome c [Actinomycetota bacterium]
MRGRGLLLGMVVAGLVVGCGGRQQASPLSGEAAQGRQLVEQYGCVGCHTTDGRRGVGPSWKNLYGSHVELADGTAVIADEDYLRRSILEPDAQIVAGYPPGLMASQVPPGSIAPQQADLIVAYLKTLGTPPPSPATNP